MKYRIEIERVVIFRKIYEFEATSEDVAKDIARTADTLEPLDSGTLFDVKRTARPRRVSDP